MAEYAQHHLDLLAKLDASNISYRTTVARLKREFGKTEVVRLTERECRIMRTFIPWLRRAASITEEGCR